MTSQLNTPVLRIASSPVRITLFSFRSLPAFKQKKCQLPGQVHPLPSPENQPSRRLPGFTAPEAGSGAFDRFPGAGYPDGRFPFSLPSAGLDGDFRRRS
jgi:hypothetical protein